MAPSAPNDQVRARGLGPYSAQAAHLPKNGKAVPTIPTMNDNPFVGNFPVFKKVPNISEAS